MKKHLTLAVSIGALVCACVVGMTALWDLPVLAKERHALIATGDGWQEEDIATADGWQDKDIVDEEEVDADKILSKTAKNGGMYQRLDLSGGDIQIDTPGKYVIYQSTGVTDYDINFDVECEIWLDGLNGDIDIFANPALEGEGYITTGTARLHLLSDCSIGEISIDGANDFYVDSKDLNGKEVATYTLTMPVFPVTGKTEISNINLVAQIYNWGNGALISNFFGRDYSCELTVNKGSITGGFQFMVDDDRTEPNERLVIGKLIVNQSVLNSSQFEVAEAKLADCVINMTGEMNGDIETLANGDIEIPKFTATNTEWNVEGLLSLFNVNGTIKDSTLNLSAFDLTDSQLKLENCKIAVQTSPENMRYDDDTEDNRMPVNNSIDVDTFDKDCKLTFLNCDVSAWNIGCRGQDGFRGSIVFDNSDLDMQNTDELKGACGIDIGGDQSEVGNAVGEGTLEIKNKSNVTIKTHERGIQLYNNAILSISDSEVVIDGGWDAVFGFTEWEDETYKNDIPQLKLLDGVVIREGGKWFSYMHETDDEGWTGHVCWIGSSSNPSKHVEIGKPKETGGSGSGNGGSSGGGSSSSGSSSSGGTTTTTAVSNIMTVSVPSITEGTWEKQGNIWKLKKADGLYAAGQWALLDGKWYLLNHQGSMVIGWQQVNGVWYAFGVDGSMLTGWQMINDKWYYLDANGAMLANTTTPDGHQVGSSGERIS